MADLVHVWLGVVPTLVEGTAKPHRGGCGYGRGRDLRAIIQSPTVLLESFLGPNALPSSLAFPRYACSSDVIVPYAVVTHRLISYLMGPKFKGLGLQGCFLFLVSR